MTEPGPLEPPPSPRYGTFTRRLRALVVDTAITSGAVVLVFILGDATRALRGSGRVTLLLIVAVLLLYEPILVSRRGATIGHARNQLQVVDARTGSWPSFGRALGRYFIKLVLGLPSFITMALTRKHQVVHDLLTRTTVQVPAEEDSAEFHTERVDEPELVLPSRRRRFVVVALYLAVLFVAYVVAIMLVDPAGCARDQTCTGGTRIAVEGFALAWLALSLATIVAGWKGLLFGARRTRQPSPE